MSVLWQCEETVNKTHTYFWTGSKEKNTLLFTFKWSEMPNPDPLYKLSL